MKKAIVFTLFVAFLFACSQSDVEEGTTSTPAAASVDGGKIYKTYCITCHGLYGDMGASGAFNLQTSTLPVAERINVITNGRKVMTPFKELLSEEKIKAVAEYTMTLKK
ncbi:MAG: cytochrome c [Bacteroidetes bacterium]|nr:cytochrome c [Bacteroidota bacterium]